MQKVINKQGAKETVFNKYVIGDSDICPECGRPFKDFDLEKLKTNKTMSCLKCGAKLSRE